MEIPSEWIGIMKIFENNRGLSVFNLEIQENHSFWFSFEPGTTGKRISLTTCEPGNTGKGTSLITCELRNTGTRTNLITCEPRSTGTRTILITCDPWRADGRPGRVTEKHKERIHFGNMYFENSEYCIYCWILTFWHFYKKDARRTMTKIGPKIVPRSLIWDRFRTEN